MSENSGVISTGPGGMININNSAFGNEPHVTNVTLTTPERTLLNSVREHVASDHVKREHDIFLSHASADHDTAQSLGNALVKLGADVWVDNFSLRPGRSFVRAIDRGIAQSRIGVVLVTPAVIAGRPWMENEFSALLNGKETVIPILHGVTAEQLRQYSPLLHVKECLSTAGHSFEEIAKVIVSVLEPE